MGSSLDIQYRLLRADAVSLLIKVIQLILKDLNAKDIMRTASKDSGPFTSRVSLLVLIGTAGRLIREHGGIYRANFDDNDNLYVLPQPELTLLQHASHHHRYTLYRLQPRSQKRNSHSHKRRPATRSSSIERQLCPGLLLERGQTAHTGRLGGYPDKAQASPGDGFLGYTCRLSVFSRLNNWMLDG